MANQLPPVHKFAGGITLVPNTYPLAVDATYESFRQVPAYSAAAVVANTTITIDETSPYTFVFNGSVDVGHVLTFSFPTPSESKVGSTYTLIIPTDPGAGTITCALVSGTAINATTVTGITVAAQVSVTYIQTAVTPAATYAAVLSRVNFT